MGKKVCIIITIFLLAAAAVMGIFEYSNDFFLEIDGTKINKEEFLDAAAKKKYEVISYFTQGTGNNVDAGFWEEDRDGEIPYKKLADAAVDDLRYVHAVYSLAREKGYIEDDSYQGLIKRWMVENQERKQKIAKGEAVYGLSEYTLDLFREYEMDSLQKRYCGDTGNEGMTISDEDRQVYYEAHRENYRREADRTFDYVKIPYGEEGLGQEEISSLRESLTAVYKKMDGAHTLAELAGADKKLAPYLEHVQVTAGELSVLSRTIGDVLEYGWELAEGESTAVLDEYGCLYLIACTEKKENEDAALEEVKDHINKALREERYEAMIQERAKNSQTEGDMDRIYFFLKKHIDN